LSKITHQIAEPEITPCSVKEYVTIFLPSLLALAEDQFWNYPIDFKAELI